MISIPEHIAVILEKHLQGRQSPADEQVLQAWRATPEHERLYQQMSTLWQETGHVLQQPAFNTKAAWRKVDAVLKPKMSPIRMTLMIAASIAVVLVLIKLVFFQERNPTRLIAEANSTFVLPDGSTAILRKGATISYQQDGRDITLEAGEVFFDISQEATHPFCVHTDRTNIEVLGTSFLIKKTAQADELVVASGKVAFSNQQERHIVSARESAVFNEKGFKMEPVTDSNYISWETGMLQFDNTPIDKVAAQLSAHYNLYIRSTLSQPERYSLTAKFDRQPVEQVLEEIKLLLPLNYYQHQDTIILSAR